MENKNEEIAKHVQPKTYAKFKLQLSILRKIIIQSLWIGRNTFPESIVYQVSCFVFRNPLALRYPVYKLSLQRELKPNQTFILRKKYFPISSSNHKNLESKGQLMQSSALLTIVKQWKPIQMSEQNYNDVLQRGKHFCNFLSNIKLYSLSPELAQIDVDPLKDYNNYQKKQKQKSKYHYLISDHREITYKSLQQIWRYEKDKKINIVVIKSFINLMNKNIAIVKIEENYCSSTLGCEGKYLYFQNQYHLPLTKGDYKQENNLPWLQVDRNKNTWKVGRQEHRESLDLYKEVASPFTRRKQSLITRSLAQLKQEDIWIQASLDKIL